MKAAIHVYTMKAAPLTLCMGYTIPQCSAYAILNTRINIITSNLCKVGIDRRANKWTPSKADPLLENRNPLQLAGSVRCYGRRRPVHGVPNLCEAQSVLLEL
jgi:hypothetical protein